MMRVMKQVGCGVLPGLLAVMLAVGLSLAFGPARAWAAEDSAEPGPAFIVAVADQEGAYVLEPTLVPYDDADPDESVRDALERAGVGFSFDGAGGIESVCGQAPENALYGYTFTNYDERDSALLAAVPAHTVTALFVSAADVGGLADGHLALLDQVRAFLMRSDGVRNYPDAVAGFERALDGIPRLGSGQAAEVASDFKDAMDAYDAIMNGKKHRVSFTVTAGGKAVGDASVVLTDQYGNETRAAVASGGCYLADVVALDYSYEAMAASGLDGVRCTKLSVTGNQAIDVELPVGQWFGSVNLMVKSNGYAPCATNGASVTERGQRGITYVVPDVVKPVADLMVLAKPSDSVASQPNSYPFYVVYSDAQGTSRVEQVAYSSRTFSPPLLVQSGTEGAQCSFEVRHRLADRENTYQVEVCPASIERSGTLAGIDVRDAGVPVLGEFDPYRKVYDVYVTGDEVTVEPQLRGTSDDGYDAQVAGIDAGAGPVAVAVPETARDSALAVRVAVTLDGANLNTYRLNVHKVDAASVMFTHASDVDVEVRNASGFALPQNMHVVLGGGLALTQFRLALGAGYSYVATKGGYYHATASFDVAGDASVNVPTPPTENALDEAVWWGRAVAPPLALGRDNLWGSGVFECLDASDVHDQTWLVPDTWTSQVWMRVHPKDGVDAPAGYSYAASYVRQDTGELQDTSTQTGAAAPFSSANKGDYGCLSGALRGLTASGGASNAVTFTVTTGTDPESGAVFSQDYRVTVARGLTLDNLAAGDGAHEQLLRRGDGTFGFDRTVSDYTVEVPAGTSTVDVSMSFPPERAHDAVAGRYSAVVGDAAVTNRDGSVATCTVDVNPARRSSSVPVRVRHDDPATPDAVYRLNVVQMPKTPVSFALDPADALVSVIDPQTGERVFANDEGAFELVSGYSYDYTVAARGHVGASGSLVASEGLVVPVTLASAPDNPDVDAGLAATWPYFRADADNNAAVASKTPTSSDDALLYWASKLGGGYESEATGCPILVDGFLYTYSGDRICKLDTVTGELVASGTMAGTSSFAITPMTYAEGMVFVALSGGRVEAFSATTLESLWLYESPHGGQPNCPITYYDGCVYTGFWNWSDTCDFVCLTVTDEDPSEPGSKVEDDPDHPGWTRTVTGERKVALWEVPHEGGFYWAGAWAGDGHVVVGSDDPSISAGSSVERESKGTGALYSIDAATGEVVDTLASYPGAGNVGNIRSTVVRDPDSGRLYYSARGGYLCSVSLNADGTFDRAGVQAVRLRNNASDGVVSASSTLVICNGRAYVGADHGAYNAYDGQSVDVVDLKTGTVAYVVNMQGRPQASGLVSTAYQADDGYTRVYYFDNYTPGKLRCFKDKPGQTVPIETVEEEYRAGGQTSSYRVAPAVFCPQGAQAQYCICSPIADENGVIYFKNDSGYTMAVGPKVTGISVEEPPTRTVYAKGERFDPSGMKVVAEYSNGTRRDVSAYVSYPDEPMTEPGKVEVKLSFEHVLYQASETNQGARGFDAPTATVTVEVEGATPAKVLTEKLDTARATDWATGTVTSYEFKLEAAGAPASYSWELAGTLPKGLKFDGETGVISGTPAAGSGGSYPLTATVTNGYGEPESRELVLEVLERPRVTSATPLLAVARLGEAASYQFNASGYPAPASFAMQEGYRNPYDSWVSHTPTGLTMNPLTGELSGVPLEEGTFHLRIYATNALGDSVPSNFVLTVTSAPEIVTGALPGAVEGSAYSFKMYAKGEPAPTFSWEAAEGSTLPPGLELAEDGTISGTPTEQGVYSIVVTAANEREGASGAPEAASDSCTFTLAVEDASAQMRFVKTEMDEATVGQPYSFSVEVAGSPQPDSVSLVSGDSSWYYNNDHSFWVDTVTADGGVGLPPGLSYDAETRTFTGTPQTGGRAWCFKMKMSNAQTGKSVTSVFRIFVKQLAPMFKRVRGLPIFDDSGAEPVYYIAYHKVWPHEFTVNLTGRNPGGRVEVDGPNWMAWKESQGGGDWDVYFTASGNPNSELHCPAPDAEPFTMTLKASNDYGSIEKSFKICVLEEAHFNGDTGRVGLTLELPEAHLGEPYEASLGIVGTPWPEAVVTGLPAGLRFDPKTGVVSGTPTMTGAFDVEASLSNFVTRDESWSDKWRHDMTFKLAVTDEPSVAATSLRAGQVGTFYSANLGIAGYPYPEVQVDGLPAGLAFDDETGRVQGVPSESGIFTVVVEARVPGDTSEEAAVKRELPLTIYRALALDADALGQATVGVPYEGSLAFDSELEDAELTGLPDGLGYRVDGDAVVIEGTPSESGDFAVSVAVHALDGSAASGEVVLAVDPAEAPVAMRASAGLFPWRVGVANSVDLVIRLGAQGSPREFSWSVAEGSSLPAGLALSEGGVLSGTPTKVGANSFAVECGNGVGEPARCVLRLDVMQDASVGAATLPKATAGERYEARVPASGYPAPVFSWVAASGSKLPDGLDLDSGTGTISGTPSAAGTYRVVVSAENDLAGDSRQLTLTVEEKKVPKVSISGATVEVPGTFTFTGKALKPNVRVKMSVATAGTSGSGLSAAAITTKTLTKGKDYTVSYASNLHAGTAKVTVTGMGDYKDTATGTFKIAKAKQPMKAAVIAKFKKQATVKLPDVKKKAAALARPVSATGAKGTVTYQNASSKAAAKKIKVDAKTGKLTVPKGTKKGTYSVKVRASAAGTADYESGTADVTVKVAVEKAEQPMKASVIAKFKKQATVKLSDVKKKAVTLARPVSVTKAQGTVTYKNASGTAAAKKIKVNAKTGKLTVPKGTKQGTYSVKVRASAAGTADYKAGTADVTVKVVVK